ncbi:EAL domain-containing protein [Sphingomonas sp. CJ20]
MAQVQDFESEARRIGSACHILVKISFANTEAVGEAYGREAARLFVSMLVERAEQFVQGAGMVEWSGISLDVLVFDPEHLSALRGLGGSSDTAIVSALVFALARSPLVVAPGVEVLPLIVAAGGQVEPFAAPALAEVGVELTRRLYAATPLFGALAGSEEMRALYVRDMAVAVMVAEALEDERLLMLWEPVAGVDEDAALLYQVGAERIVVPGGKLREPDSFIPALERTGMIRALDVHVMRMTIERLRANPTHRLGCRMSAQSAVIDGWWTDVLEELERDPDVAARLIVEFASGPAAHAIGLMVAFADRLRWLGCAIAVDALGSCLTSLDRAFRADIIKIDGAHLERAVERASEQDIDRLRHLIGLAKTLATDVVIGGVEDDVRLKAAQHAGARWFRGARLGSPSFTLRSVRSGIVPPLVAGVFSKALPLGVSEAIPQ